jgi:hypothetical protein
MAQSRRLGILVLGAACLALAGCTYETQFESGYVPDEAPSYIAYGRMFIVMPEEQRNFTYEGSPQSEVGDFTTLTIPIGEIVESIARQVFTTCFASGVEFVEAIDYDDEFVVALSGDMQDFVYRYQRVIDQGFTDEDRQVWITPEVEISFRVRASDHDGRTILDKTYESGVSQGESYQVTSRPAERISQTLHATLHALMLEVAADLRPLLVGECEITDIV